MSTIQTNTDLKEIYTRSDHYHNSFLLDPNDEALLNAEKTREEEGLMPIAVSPAMGKFLNLIVKSISAKRVLEIGTLAGYSTICLARGLPKDGTGKLISLELEEKNAEISRKNIDKAGLSSIAQVIVGPAIESLKTLKPDPPFDLTFIDADKESNLEYFIEAKRLLKKGGVIIVDNVVRNGQVSDPSTYTDSRSEGVRRLLKFLKDDKEVECTTIQTVGEKNHDGFLYAYII
ncbi:class I-like SAM-binding methyltransferase superfamily protein [Abortiporus biennis]